MTNPQRDPAPHDDPRTAVVDTDIWRERFGPGSGIRWWSERIGEMQSALMTAAREIDRLRAQIESAHNTCARSGGCIPREEWNRHV